MKNMNRFLVSLSAFLVFAMAHASVENKSLEARVLKELRVRQQVLKLF